MSTGGEGGAERLGSGSGLLEREQELEAIDAVIAAAAAGGSAGLVLVEGPAGMGKSRLVAEARRLASGRGQLVLAARGGELEREFPFGVVRQLFEARLIEEPVRARLLSGAAAGGGAVFGFGDERVDGEGAFAALHGLYWLTVNLSAERPLLLAVDDLHWCDRSSLRFLAGLARRLEDLPLVLMGSVRPSEPGADQGLLAELTSDPHARVLVPRPLSAEAVDGVLRDRLGDGVESVFALACHASTQGNPLLLSELVKALVADRIPPDAAHVGVVADLGPRAASRAVLLRLARLSADAVVVARALSVLGEGAELTVVAELARLDPEAVAAAIRALVRAEIVRPDPPLGFVHPLVQVAVGIWHPASASCATSVRRSSSRGCAHRPSRSRRTCSRCRPAEKAGRSTSSVTRPAPRLRRATRMLRSRRFAGRSRSRRHPSSGRSSCSSWDGRRR